MNEFINTFLEGVLSTVLSVVGAALAAWMIAQARVAWKKAQISHPEMISELMNVLPVFVKAAEQMRLAGLIQDKKVFVLDLAEKWLKSRGFDLDLHLIDAAIEAVVWDEFGKDKLAEMRFASTPGTVTMVPL